MVLIVYYWSLRSNYTSWSMFKHMDMMKRLPAASGATWGRQLPRRRLCWAPQPRAGLRPWGCTWTTWTWASCTGAQKRISLNLNFELIWTYELNLSEKTLKYRKKVTIAAFWENPEIFESKININSAKFWQWLKKIKNQQNFSNF